MVNTEHQNGNNGNGSREKVEISFPREEYNALTKCAEDKDVSINAYIRESVKNSIQKRELHDIVSRACEMPTESAVWSVSWCSAR